MLFFIEYRYVCGAILSVGIGRIPFFPHELRRALSGRKVPLFVVRRQGVFCFFQLLKMLRNSPPDCFSQIIDLEHRANPSFPHELRRALSGRKVPLFVVRRQGVFCFFSVAQDATKQSTGLFLPNHRFGASGEPR